MSGFIEKLRDLRQDGEQIEQSKLDSLKMNALKTALPIVIDSIYRSNLDEEKYNSILANNLKMAIEMQKDYENKIIQTVGPIYEQNTYLYRRAWSLGAKAICATNDTEIAKSATTLDLLLYRNDESTKLNLEKAKISPEELINYQELMRDVICTSPYDDENNYNSTLDSTIATTSQRITETVSSIDFGICYEEAYELATNGCSVFTDKMLELFQENAHRHQELMRLKSCITHASKMFLAVFKVTASSINTNFNLHTFDTFDEMIAERCIFVQQSFSYCVDLISNSLLDRATYHNSVVQATKNYKSHTNYKLGDLLEGLHKQFSIAQGCTYPGITPIVYLQRYIKAIKLATSLATFLEKRINDVICPINDFEMKFTHRLVWDSISQSISMMNKRQILNSEIMLQSAINLVIYLNSDLPANNNTLDKLGLNEHKIIQYRQNRDRCYSILNNTLNYKKIAVSLVTELSRALMHTQMFCWGINAGYLSAHVCTSITQQALSIFNYRNALFTQSNPASLFQMCLYESSKAFCKRWEKEAELTLNSSTKSYARGKISVQESQNIINRVTRLFVSDIEDSLTQYRKLRSTLAELFPDEVPDTQSRKSPNRINLEQLKDGDLVKKSPTLNMNRT